jgi:hypothetical protein
MLEAETVRVTRNLLEEGNCTGVAGRDTQRAVSLRDHVSCMSVDLPTYQPVYLPIYICVSSLSTYLYEYNLRGMCVYTHIRIYVPSVCMGLGIFLFTTASRAALGSTHPPVQWVPGVLSLGVKRPVREADHSPPSNAEVKEWVKLYIHFPMRLHGVVLS